MLSAEQALQGAHYPTLLMVLVQLTGDERWLGERYRPARPRGFRDPDDGGLGEEVRDEIRAAALAALGEWREGADAAPVPPERFVRMMSIFIGEQVGEEYVELASEEIGLRDRDEPWATSHTRMRTDALDVVIVGAGFSGLCMAIKCARARIPYVVLEQAPALGGVWRENVYPGVKVDSPSHLYQLSFAAQPDWPGYYSRGARIRAYLERLADRYDVRPHIRFDTELLGARWEGSRWRLQTSTGALEADVLVSAVGQLNRPSIPAITGAERFAGPAMHTAEWNPSIDVAGRRVAVIGTGASSMQLVPAIAGVAEKVTVLQRSPQWAVPNPDLDREVSEDARWLLAHVPLYAGWYRFRQFWLWNDNIWPTLQIDPDWPDQERSINAANDAHREFLTEHIRSTLAGREDLIARCLPTYPPYFKRMLMDTGWFATMRRDDVELVTDAITQIEPDGLRTADGRLHRADVLVYATGFRARRMLWPLQVVGRDGVVLRDVWGEDDASAHLGITVPGFPNLFCLYGPNTNLGHGGSVVFHAELQVRYVMGMLRAMLDRDLAAVEVREAVHDDYVERVDAAHQRMIWSHRGASTWYRNAAGRVVTNSPWRLIDYWRMTREPDLSEYLLTPRP
ncbi:MAG TPA: NAD(P)/FAD-dependent oxidoreductase [Solirubrobacteraceae bacterium]|nr:NAD(P)/FAD-dependent oxidoreductase [Solirubrobacteraceae bacterium]